jgi:hypothetical protein
MVITINLCGLRVVKISYSSNLVETLLKILSNVPHYDHHNK